MLNYTIWNDNKCLVRILIFYTLKLKEWEENVNIWKTNASILIHVVDNLVKVRLYFVETKLVLSSMKCSLLLF